MIATAAIPVIPVEDDLSFSLREILSGCEFNDGAVLIQVPTVPPQLVEREIADNWGYFAYPPLGLLYLSATLRSLGIKSSIVDINFEVLKASRERKDDLQTVWQQAVDNAITNYDKPFIGVSFMFDPLYPELRSICEYVKQRYPGLCIAVGGVGATADPDRILKDGFADLVFSNEGEQPLVSFYSFVREETQTPPGNLSFRDTSGNIQHTVKTTGGNVDLDIRREYYKIPMGQHHHYGALNNFSRMRGTDVPFATVISRRGCRAQCTFCSVRKFNGVGVRVREVEGVIDEMIYLHDNFGIRHFDWLDDDLLYDKKAAIHMFREIERRLPDITWAAWNGLIAAAITPEILEALQDSNCMGFTVGLEAGNPDILRKIRKPATIKKFFEFAELAKDYPKLHYLVNFILGLPDEHFGQMLDSFSVAVRAQLDWNNFFTFQPLKNTDAYVVYGGMDEGLDEEDLRKRGTTMNFNPVRAGAFESGNINSDIATGYDIFDLPHDLLPGHEQRKEIWFTFNYITNFLRTPSLVTGSEQRIRNAIGWMQAIGTAYADNPTIDTVVYYLQWRLGEYSQKELDTTRNAALKKYKDSEYWQQRDKQFRFSALLDNDIPPIDKRSHSFFSDELR